jgi:hypothetical protein
MTGVEAQLAKWIEAVQNNAALTQMTAAQTPGNEIDLPIRAHNQATRPRRAKKGKDDVQVRLNVGS